MTQILHQPRFIRIARFAVSLLLATVSSGAVAIPIAWAVGANGTVVTSTDFGSTWTPQSSGTSQDLYGVDFSGSRYGIAVGANGTLITTKDGVSWSASPSGVTAALYDVIISGAVPGMPGSNVAAALGDGGNGTRTLDGGASWQPISLGSTANFRALSKEAGLTVVAVGEDRVFSRSNDGGVTWTSPTISTAQAPLAPLNWAGITGIGGTSAVAVGADQRGGMYSVYNGSAWSALVYIGSFADTPTPFGFQLFDVAYTGSTIVAVGKNGIVTRSTNGGLDWTAPVSVTTFDLLDIEFFDALNGLAVGTGGSAIRTTDGGVTWSTPIHAADATLNALAIVDSDVSSVSEPSSIALVMIGFLGLIVRKRAIARLPSLQRLRAHFVYSAN